MSTSERIPAFLAYLLLPIGWLTVLLFGRRSPAARFHCRQSIGIVVFVLGMTGAWAVIAWLLAWIPFGAVFSVALFGIVIAAYILAVIMWVGGMANALRGKIALLPIVGRWAERLPLG